MEAIQEIIAILKERYPEALCALQYRRDYELMISVRLSAQCTDAGGLCGRRAGGGGALCPFLRLL